MILFIPLKYENLKNLINNSFKKHLWFVLIAIQLLIPGLTLAQPSHSKVLLDFENKFKTSNVVFNDAKATVLTEGQNHLLQVTLGHKDTYPSARLKLSDTDLSGYIGIAMDIKNLGSSPIAIEAQCYNENDKTLTIADGAKFFYRSIIVLNPGESDSLFITLSRSSSSLPQYINEYFKGMFGLPGGYVMRRENLDLTKITHVSVFKQKSDGDYNITIDNVRAVGKYDLPGESILKTSFFPFVDKFGQYKYKEWPNKVRSIEDIYTQKEEEAADVRANPGPVNWDKYGGWASGPTLKATGHFRVEKYQDKWWLVDPEGKLFWSHGIVAIGFSQRTPLAGRENYFSVIPEGGDFYQSNLMLKYGGIWDSSPRDAATGFIFKRLPSWGINTLAGSELFLTEQKKIPYTFTIRSGVSNPIPDTLKEAAFRKIVAERFQTRNILNSLNDPWCIGFFVDNELSWPVGNSKEAIDTYFRVIDEELKKIAPDKLYLGCRINSRNFNRNAFEAAAKYCDVISINHYDYNLADFKETQGLDKPIIIGEFHFGALDRGLLHSGLRSVSNQNQRARVYMHFINQALESPYFIGTHWFQYVDQVCTGRGDGENYQIGFVDICDRPYPEMIDALRKISSYMYEYRLDGKARDATNY